MFGSLSLRSSNHPWPKWFIAGQDLGQLVEVHNSMLDYLDSRIFFDYMCEGIERTADRIKSWCTANGVAVVPNSYGARSGLRLQTQQLDIVVDTSPQLHINVPVQQPQVVNVPAQQVINVQTPQPQVINVQAAQPQVITMPAPPPRITYAPAPPPRVIYQTYDPFTGRILDRTEGTQSSPTPAAIAAPPSLPMIESGRAETQEEKERREFEAWKARGVGKVETQEEKEKREFEEWKKKMGH